MRYFGKCASRRDRLGGVTNDLAASRTSAWSKVVGLALYQGTIRPEEAGSDER